MNLGNKKIRYAIVKKDGNMRQVTGAKLGSGNAVTYSKEDYYVVAQNVGSGDGTVLIKNATENTKRASYIIKDSANNVHSWGWIENTGTTVIVPQNYYLYTDAIMAHDGYIAWNEGNIFTFLSGKFKITKWNTSNLCQAFHWQGDKIDTIPEKWPVGVTNIQAVFQRCDIVNTPSFENLQNCSTLEDLYNTCEKLENINFTGYDSIKSGANYARMLVTAIITKDYSGTDNDKSFYDFYKHAWKTNGTITDMYKGLVYKCADSDGIIRSCKPFCFSFIKNSAGGYLEDFIANSSYRHSLTPSHYTFRFESYVPFESLNASKEYKDGSDDKWYCYTFNNITINTGLNRIFKYTSNDFDFATDGSNLYDGDYNLTTYSFRSTPGNESNVEPSFNDDESKKNDDGTLVEDGSLKNCGTYVLLNIVNITFTVQTTIDEESGENITQITNKVVTKKSFTQNNDGTVTIT